MTMMAVSVAPGRRRVRLRELLLELLDTLAIVSHDVPDMRDAIKVDFELVDLGHDVLEARYLSIGIVHQVAGTVILLHCHDGALFAKVLYAGLDLLHQAIEMARQCG